MVDLMLNWGGDLEVGATGDLRLTAASDAVRERVLRRLLTNLGAYIWHLDYGGGLGSLVGSPVREGYLQSIVNRQMRMEQSIATTPEPTVSMNSNAGSPNTLYLTIKYRDSFSNDPNYVTVTLGV